MFKIGDKVKPVKDFAMVLKSDSGVITRDIGFQSTIDESGVIGRKHCFFVHFPTLSGPFAKGKSDMELSCCADNLELCNSQSPCECGNKDKPWGCQLHSHWCPGYKREF